MPNSRGPIGQLPPTTAVELSRLRPTSWAIMSGLKTGQVLGSSRLNGMTSSSHCCACPERICNRHCVVIDGRGKGRPRYDQRRDDLGRALEELPRERTGVRTLGNAEILA